MGVADGEDVGVALRLSIAVAEELGTATGVGDDAPSDDVGVAATSEAVAVTTSAGVSVMGSRSARAPGCSAARRPRPQTARARIDRMAMVTR